MNMSSLPACFRCKSQPCECADGITLYHADCRNVLPLLEAGSVDLVLTDPPYGTTACKWDSVIPLGPMWKCLKRTIKPLGLIVLTASQPFASALVMSNPIMFKHEWIWIKNRGSNFANTVREPMKEHEYALVFGTKQWTYNKQMQDRSGSGLKRAQYLVKHNDQTRETTRKFEGRKHHKVSDLRVPSSWQKFNVEVGLHPTQKPVALMDYLIKTYSNDGELVLDFAVGSGTTGLACKDLGRRCIMVEIEEKYCEIAAERLKQEVLFT